MNNALSFLGLAKKAGRLEAGEAPAGAAARASTGCLLLLASDAAPNTCRRAQHFADIGKMPLVKLPFDKREVGGVIGRSSCAILVLTDVGFSTTLCKKLAAAYGAPYDAVATGLTEQVADRGQQRRYEKRSHEKKRRRPPI